jgi:hypothetical protein
MRGRVTRFGIMKSRAFLCAALLLAVAPCQAQTSQDQNQNQNQQTDSETSSNSNKEEDGPKRFWQAVLPGGHYMVAIDRIASISQQTYVLDGGVVVHEVNVDTDGQALARFYYLEPPKTSSSTTAQMVDRGRELVDQAGQRSGSNMQDMVMKKYPETTHAKCIEYRLKNEKELDALYKSLRETWESGKGRKFTVKAASSQ